MALPKSPGTRARALALALCSALLSFVGHAAESTSGSATVKIKPGVVCPSGQQWNEAQPWLGCHIPPANCNASVQVWSVGGNNCSASVPFLPHGSSTTVSSSGPNTGSTTATCNNGAVNLSGSSCASPPPADCVGGPIGWIKGGNACSTNVGAMSHGTSKTIFSTNGNDGSAVLACSNGSFSTSSTSCTPPAPAACSGTSLNWSQGGANCSGPVGGLASGSSTSVTSTNGNFGSVTASCSAGSWSLSGGTCAAPPPSSCPGKVMSWTSGGTTCSGPAPGTLSGGTATVTSTNGNAGTATASCNAGVWSAAAGSCSAPPPPSPPPPAFIGCNVTKSSVWGVGCRAVDTYNLAHGATSSRTANTDAGFTGWITYVCNNGMLSIGADIYCMAKMPPDPPALPPLDISAWQQWYAKYVSWLPAPNFTGCVISDGLGGLVPCGDSPITKAGLADGLDAEAMSAISASQTCNNSAGLMESFPKCVTGEGWDSSCEGSTKTGKVGSTKWSCSYSFWPGASEPEWGEYAFFKWVKVRIWR